MADRPVGVWGAVKAQTSETSAGTLFALFEGEIQRCPDQASMNSSLSIPDGRNNHDNMRSPASEWLGDPNLIIDSLELIRNGSSTEVCTVEVTSQFNPDVIFTYIGSIGHEANMRVPI